MNLQEEKIFIIIATVFQTLFVAGFISANRIEDLTEFEEKEHNFPDYYDPSGIMARVESENMTDRILNGDAPAEEAEMADKATNNGTLIDKENKAVDRILNGDEPADDAEMGDKASSNSTLTVKKADSEEEENDEDEDEDEDDSSDLEDRKGRHRKGRRKKIYSLT